MKTIKFIIISVLISAGLVSCDFLDKEPTYLTPETYYQNEADATSALTGVYSNLQQQAFYGNEYLFLVGGDDLGHYGGSGRAPYKAGLICNNANSSDIDVAGFWYDLYSGINRANMFLEYVDNTPGMSAALKAQYKAEARFLRAFYYFNLVQCWGDVPFKTTSTETVNGLGLPRTDKETIYDFIVKEMDECANDLKSSAELNFTTGRISKSAAWGILARVYLFRAGEHFRDNKAADDAKVKEYFGKASTYAQKVMGEGHGLTERYWRIFVDLSENKYNSTDKKESIWEVEFAGNRSTDVRAEGRIGNIIGIPAPDYSSNSNITGKADPGYSYGFIYATPKLYELYEANGDTARCNWNIAPFEYVKSDNGVTGRKFEYGKKDEIKYPCFTYGTGDVEKAANDKTNSNYNRAAAKYRREYEPDKKNKNDTQINFPILRYADVLLMIAEAENEINPAPSELAYQCLKEVRKRAGLETKSGMGKEEFRQAVKDERAMELCFEYTRRFDLIRWGEYVKNMNELAPRAQAGTNWTLGPSNVYTYFKISSVYNYFPIPANEMAVNKEITKNNPGW